MAIGHSWAEGSFVDSSWAQNAWHTFAHVFTTAIERVQIITRSIRTQIVGL